MLGRLKSPMCYLIFFSFQMLDLNKHADLGSQVLKMKETQERRNSGSRMTVLFFVRVVVAQFGSRS